MTLKLHGLIYLSVLIIGCKNWDNRNNKETNASKILLSEIDTFQMGGKVFTIENISQTAFLNLKSTTFDTSETNY